MAITGSERNYDQKWNFAVEIDGLEVAWFSTAGPLEVEVGVVEVNEGGAMIPNTAPGKPKFAEITLTNGATNNMDFWNWMKEVADASRGRGEPDGRYKRNAAIVQKERDKSAKRRYPLYRAWPKKFTAGEWDAGAEEAVMQSIVLRYDYFDQVNVAT